MILVCYAFGAAIGALASEWGASALFAPAAVLTAAVLLPEPGPGSRHSDIEPEPLRGYAP